MTQLYNAGLYVTDGAKLYSGEFIVCCAHVFTWRDSDAVQAEVAKFHAGTRDGGLKAFVIKYREPDQNGIRWYAKDDPLLLLHNPKVQAIAESAIGPARCLCIDLWHNPPNCKSKDPKWSQSWHRDPEDSQIVKVFVYFSDVDEQSGPFEYVWCSHLNWFDLMPPQPKGYNENPVDVSQIPPALFAKVTGGPGTVAFCQTSGLHKGGHGEKARTMAVITYVPEQSVARTLFEVR